MSAVAASRAAAPIRRRLLSRIERHARLLAADELRRTRGLHALAPDQVERVGDLADRVARLVAAALVDAAGNEPRLERTLIAIYGDPDGSQG